MAHLTPVQRLAGAVSLGLLVVVATTLLSLEQPWIGLDGRWDSTAQTFHTTASRGPSMAIPAGTLLESVSADEQTFVFEAADLIIEPDGNLPTFSDYRRFLQRQHQLAELLRSDELRLTAQDGSEWVVTPQQHRPLSDLSVDFWIQQVVALLAWLICAAVWVFRRGDISARYLLVSGFSTLMFASGAAVYTTRELAIGLPELYILKTMNFGGGLLYLATLAALLWHYPTRLGSTRISIGMLVLMLGWYLAQEAGVFESMLVARRLPGFIAMLTAFVLAFAQWRHTRRDPLARAALRWFLLAWLMVSSLLGLIIFVPQLHGVDTGPVQGYSFLLLLLVYGGLAFGILRYRLFELGEWWGHILSWILGAALLVVLDLLLVFMLQLAPQISLALALVLCGLIWLPLRNFLWSRWLGRKASNPMLLFRDILDISHAPQRAEGQRLWLALLHQYFQPLEISIAEESEAGQQPTVREDGLVLLVPATGDLPALRLGYASGGRRLFHRSDIAAASQLRDMLHHASASRDAYQRGVNEERSRIARDLHDNIGSHLLTALHHQDSQYSKAAISRGIDEMQDIIQGLTGQAIPLADLVADLRHETGLRLAAANMHLDWPCALEETEQDRLLLDYHQQRQYRAVMRELVSNIIRHSGANRVRVDLMVEGDWLRCEFQDDGNGFDGKAPSDVKGRHGLMSLQQRLASNATLRYQPLEQGTLTRLDWRLDALVNAYG